MLEVGDRGLDVWRLAALQDGFGVSALPFSLKVLLENLLRHEGGVSVTAGDIEALAVWGGGRRRPGIAFPRPGSSCRTSPGVPAVADLAPMRDAVGDERKPTFGEGKPSDHAPLIVTLRDGGW